VTVVPPGAREKMKEKSPNAVLYACCFNKKKRSVSWGYMFHETGTKEEQKETKARQICKIFPGQKRSQRLL